MTEQKRQVEDIEPPAPSRRRIWKPTLAQAGFIMSATLASINAYYAFRGSVMVVHPPNQVILYRDGEGDRAVLMLAVRLESINAADSSHGDVLTNATVKPARGGPQFAYAGTIKPVFTSDADAGKKCSVETRCVALKGLLAIEQQDEILSIPGGGVLGTTLVYPLTGWNCTGATAACARFGTFPAAVTAIAGKPLDVRIKLSFYGDGTRELRCGTKPVDAHYLSTSGWTTMSCTQASVSGGPLI
jgi:hypothetical protein